MYETAIKLARENSSQIITAFLALIRLEKLEPYVSLEESVLISRFAVGLEQYIAYLETGNIDTWREFCVDMTKTRIAQGFDYTVVINFNKLLLKVLSEFFWEKLLPLGTIDDRPAEKMLQSLDNRLNGMHAVAISTGTATAMKIKQSQRLS
jgi:hypothetical protein